MTTPPRFALDDAERDRRAELRHLLSWSGRWPYMSTAEVEATRKRMDECPKHGLHGGACPWCQSEVKNA